MSFISWEYPFFLLATCLLYWNLPWRGRILLLLGVSYFFYAYWDVRFLALILASTATDYLCSRGIEQQRVTFIQTLLLGFSPVFWLVGYACVTGQWDTQILLYATSFISLFLGVYFFFWNSSKQHRKKGFLWLSLATNILLLGFFKYFGFFAESLEGIFNQAGWQVGWVLSDILLPVGISFYTFQSMSFTIDIYRGKTRSIKDISVFATYIAFFPQLVAGPIERAKNLLPQLQKQQVFQVSDIHAGTRLILMGLFKKIFIANNCALLANYVFSPDTELNVYWALLGAVAFAFQIYGDFSGYTDIARGSARLFGIRLMRNFHFPYFSRGPSDFWQRWHISLSSWFRDYVYIPLGGNQGSQWLTLRNLLLTMLLAGLWHGAAWPFVIWGLYHGILLVLYRSIPVLRQLETSETQRFWRYPVSILLMFCFTLVGWVIFRSPDLAYTAQWFIALTDLEPTGVAINGAFSWFLIHSLPLVLIQFLTLDQGNEASLQSVKRPWRIALYLFIILLTVSSISHEQQFIYFQF